MKIAGYIFLLSIVITSCKKAGIESSDCPSASAIEITTNSPVIEGWPLNISTVATSASLFKWTGPNGWDVNYEIYSSDANLQGKTAVTTADAGMYKVQLRNAGGCVEYEGSTEVKIIPPPLPPCTIASNTSTSNVIGVGDVAFTGVIYFQGGGGIFSVQSSAGGQTITFNFNGDNIPKPGIYTTSGYFATDETTVGCYITAGGGAYDFINNSGQSVYVNKINGKTQVSFCNADFTNPLGSAAIKISAKLVEP